MSDATGQTAAGAGPSGGTGTRLRASGRLTVAPPPDALEQDRPRRRAARPEPRPARRVGGISAGEVIALGLALGWLALVGWVYLNLDPEQARLTRSDPLGAMITMLGIFIPMAVIMLAASAARTARVLRAEIARLHVGLDALRRTAAAAEPPAPVQTPATADRIEQLGRAQAVLGAELAALQARLAPQPIAPPKERAPAPDPQPALALDTAPDVQPLAPDDFIRALDFPANERDTEGFRVLRAALEHHTTAQLVTAAQDLLTLLAQDGIYMDDLTVHRADAILWRAFAEGNQGADTAALGGIRDRSSLALTGGRMKDDPTFRDAVHHFLRTFDRVFAGFAATATDVEIMRFADTRTARAFMLTARVAGTFA